VKIKNTYQIFLFAFLIIICAIRIHLLPVPLERDEGEYAYSGQLILQGIPPFAQAYNMKMPGIYVAYAAILGIFGQSATAIHFGLLIINLLCALTLYSLGKRLYNPAVGSTSAVAFAVMSLSSSVLGLSANAEYFVLFFALLGMLALLRAIDKGKNRLFLLSGFLLGTCFLMKQHGAAFIGWGVLYLLWHELQNKTVAWKRLAERFALVGTGIIFPFTLMCIWLWNAGVFTQFWFWTFTYAHAYVSQVPLWIGLHIFNTAFSYIFSSSPLFWLLGLAGVISLLFDKTSSARSFVVISFLFFSLASICPGFYFREHYFVLLLPSVSLFSGIGVNAFLDLAAKINVPGRLRLFAFFTILGAAVIISLYSERLVLFHLTPNKV
jgi:4-amino-4-deoxy-L-arabinose transferase-like glycosyltransferase